MKKHWGLGMVIPVLGIVFSSCVTRVGAFTVISTKNIDWSRTAEFTRYNQRTTGQDIYHIIICIPTKMHVTIEDAVDRALEKVPGGVALVDAVIRNKFFWLPYLWGFSGYVVEGNVLIDPRLASIDDPVESKYLVFYAPDGDEFIKREITEDEYRSYW